MTKAKAEKLFGKMLDCEFDMILDCLDKAKKIPPSVNVLRKYLQEKSKLFPRITTPRYCR